MTAFSVRLANISSEDLNAALAALTVSGTEFMKMVGERKFDFFDDGIVTGSGNYGSCMAEQASAMTGRTVRSSAGIQSATVRLGLWNTCEDGGDCGLWWTLTALGAQVARHLAAA